MKNLIQRWTQSGPLFHNQGTFFIFDPSSNLIGRLSCYDEAKTSTGFIILAWQTLLTFNVCIVSHSVQLYFVYKNAIAVPHFLIQRCHLQKSSYKSYILLDATIPVTLTDNQVKATSIVFVRKKYLLPGHKKNLATRKIMLACLIQNISHAC